MRAPLLHWPFPPFLLIRSGFVAKHVRRFPVCCSAPLHHHSPTLHLYSLVVLSEQSEMLHPSPECMASNQCSTQQTINPLFTDVAAFQLTLAVQAVTVREDSSRTAKSQAAGGLPRLQDLAADWAQRSSDAAPSAAPAQVCFAFSHGTAKGICAVLCGTRTLVFRACSHSPYMLMHAVSGRVVPDPGGVYFTHDVPTQISTALHADAGCRWLYNCSGSS